MKLVLMALALAATSFSQADTITRSFDINSTDAGGFSAVGVDAENVYFYSTYLMVSGAVTDAGDIISTQFRGGNGDANTLASWSNSFVSTGGNYSATLNFAPADIFLSYSDLFAGGDFKNGYKWSLYANNNLVWNSGAELSAHGSSDVALTKFGVDLGGTHFADSQFFVSDDYEYSVHRGGYNTLENQVAVNLGSFSEGATVNLRYVLETYTHMSNYACGECMQMGVSVGDPFQIGNVPPAIQIAAVPEPETYALFGLGVLGVAIARRRKNA